MNPNIVSNRYDELKNKLRQELTKEINEIKGVMRDAPRANVTKTPHQSVQVISEKKPHDDTTDYFELVYQCIHTRINFLNIVSLNAQSPVEPDIDLAILHALLKG